MDDFDKTRLMPALNDAMARAGVVDAIAVQISPNILPVRRSTACLLRLLQGPITRRQHSPTR